MNNENGMNSSVCYLQMLQHLIEKVDSNDIIAIFPRKEELVSVSEQLLKWENESREENGRQPVFKGNIHARQDANYSQDRSIKSTNYCFTLVLSISNYVTYMICNGPPHNR